MFAVAPQPLLEEFHSSFLSGDLPALAAHPSANFALQAFLAAANRSPLVKALLAELKGSFTELLQRRRSGVVAAMLAACARTSAGQADASKALAAALTALHDEGKASTARLLTPIHALYVHWQLIGIQQTKPESTYSKHPMFKAIHNRAPQKRRGDDILKQGAISV